MSRWLVLAACLALVLGAGHSYLGERYFLPRLYVFARRTLHFLWHLATVAWWGAAALFWVLGRGDASTGLRVLAATFLASGVLTLIGSRGRHPAWLVFLAIAVAAWLGATGS